MHPAGIVDRGALVAATGLEQDDAGAAVHQPARDHGTGGPGTDHDDVRAATAHAGSTGALDVLKTIVMVRGEDTTGDAPGALVPALPGIS